jgi:hypothetical protein
MFQLYIICMYSTSGAGQAGNQGGEGPGLRGCLSRADDIEGDRFVLTRQQALSTWQSESGNDKAKKEPKYIRASLTMICCDV